MSQEQSQSNVPGGAYYNEVGPQFIDKDPREQAIEQIMQVAPAIGQDNWVAAGQINKRLPYFQKNAPMEKDAKERVGHPGLMSYQTMQFVQQNLERITKHEFVKRLKEDFPEEDFYYVYYIGESDFRGWMKEIGTERIHDNDAWGRTALEWLQWQEIDPVALVEGRLTDEQKRKVLDLQVGINGVWEPKNSDEMSRLLKDNDALADAMVIAHGQYIKFAYPNLTTEQLAEMSINDELEDLTSFLRNPENLYKRKVERRINQIRDRAHTSMFVLPRDSFNLMVEIAGILEGTYVHYLWERGESQMLKQLAANLLDTIRYDANRAIYEAIMQVGAANNFEDMFEA